MNCYYLSEEVSLLDVKSNKPESIFDYTSNNFIIFKKFRKKYINN